LFTENAKLIYVLRNNHPNLPTFASAPALNPAVYDADGLTTAEVCRLDQSGTQNISVNPDCSGMSSVCIPSKLVMIPYIRGPGCDSPLKALCALFDETRIQIQSIQGKSVKEKEKVMAHKNAIEAKAKRMSYPGGA
jgi:hypothetical protein